MRKKFFIGISVVIHIMAFILLSKKYINMDIMYLLGFCYAPMIISLLLCVFDTFTNKTNHSLGYSIINIIYFIVANIFITKSGALDVIYKNSQKYTSTNVTISLDSSPIFSLVIAIVMSTVLHILVVKFINKNKVQERSA